ncbi:MAG: DUF4437 domain-containing protein [Paracoccaceae bacterium]
MSKLALFAFTIGIAFSAGLSSAEPRVEVVKRADVEFIPLNPARGDASPKAGVLWGDIRQDGPSGALITFADGFASPPHIHNITYRAVVIEGLVHNDDPQAETMWMEQGSFWTQPAGEVHVTSVGPGGGTAFLEILLGPYLVRPSPELFDNGERPINVEARNVVWLDAADVGWNSESDGTAGAEMSFLWGMPNAGKINGTFLKLPPAFVGTVETLGADFKAVLVSGALSHDAGELSPSVDLESGSYFGSQGDVSHNLACAADAECVLYVRVEGKYRLTGVE